MALARFRHRALFSFLQRTSVVNGQQGRQGNERYGLVTIVRFKGSRSRRVEVSWLGAVGRLSDDGKSRLSDGRCHLVHASYMRGEF